MRETVFNIESSIRDICTSSFPLEWDEDHISYQLMKELRNQFSNRTIRFQSWSKIVDWRSFKNNGKTETNYGDISLLVNVQFSSGETLKGVAFLEAKRSYDSSNFEAIKQEQLIRIRNNAPYAQVLLYNHQEQELQLKFPDEKTWRSHFWTSPVNTVQELNKQVSKNDNWKLLRTSFPFSSFLTSRIFWGFDLDFRTELYEDIESGLNKLLESKYLGVVNVYYDHQKPVENKIGENWEEI